MIIKKKLILFEILFCFALAAIGQKNLILNPSLEEWEHHYPRYWLPLTVTPDFIKCDAIFGTGKYFNNNLDREILLKNGANGKSYFNIFQKEFVSCTLKENLEKDKLYQLTFKVNQLNKPFHFPIKKVNVKFVKNIPLQKENIEKGKEYSTIFVDDTLALQQHRWTNMKLNFKAVGGEKFIIIGFFNPDLPPIINGADKLLYSLCFDDFKLIPAEDREKMMINFQLNKWNLDNKNKLIIDSIFKNTIEEINLIGYASTIGEDKRNLELSKKRVESVANYIQQKYNIKNIKKTYLGESASTESENYQKVEIEIIDKNTEIQSSEKDYTWLKTLLKEMAVSDQKYRLVLDSLMTHKSTDKAMIADCEAKMTSIDSINIKTISAIMDTIGYPGLSKVGSEHMNNAFWILQHAPYEIRKKYFSKIEAAADICEFEWSNLAYMIDRNLVDENKPQRYGTQVFYDEKTKKFKPFPIENMKILDKLRAEHHLEPFDKYLKSFNQ